MSVPTISGKFLLLLTLQSIRDGQCFTTKSTFICKRITTHEQPSTFLNSYYAPYYSPSIDGDYEDYLDYDYDYPSYYDYRYDNYVQQRYDPYYHDNDDDYYYYSSRRPRYNNYVQRRPYQRLDYASYRRPNDPLINPHDPCRGSGSSSIGYAGYGNGYSRGYGGGYYRGGLGYTRNIERRIRNMERRRDLDYMRYRNNPFRRYFGSDYYNRRNGGYGYNQYYPRFDYDLDYAIGDRPSLARQVLRTQMPIHIQGNSLKTWITQPYVEAVHVALKSEGRPIHADVELWNGPNNIPYKLRVYVEDGYIRPFSATIGTPYGTNTVCVRNISPIEYPLEGTVAPENEVDAPTLGEIPPLNYPMIIQGNSLHTFRFDHQIQAVQVMLKTDGRPLNARIELWQGPTNVKQMVDVYTDDGLTRPFYMVIDTPGGENVVRVVNTASMAMPIDATVEAYSIGYGDEFYDGKPGAMLVQ